MVCNSGDIIRHFGYCVPGAPYYQLRVSNANINSPLYLLAKYENSAVLLRYKYDDGGGKINSVNHN